MWYSMIWVDWNDYETWSSVSWDKESTGTYWSIRHVKMEYISFCDSNSVMLTKTIYSHIKLEGKGDQRSKRQKFIDGLLLDEDPRWRSMLLLWHTCFYCGMRWRPVSMCHYRLVECLVRINIKQMNQRNRKREWRGIFDKCQDWDIGIRVDQWLCLICSSCWLLFQSWFDCQLEKVFPFHVYQTNHPMETWIIWHSLWFTRMELRITSTV